MTPIKPQRIALPSTPGSLLKRLQGTIRLIRTREIGDRDPVYLTLVRQCPCLYCGLEPAGEAAHVRRQSGVHNKRGGMGKKRPIDGRFRFATSTTCCSTRLENWRSGTMWGLTRFWSASSFIASAETRSPCAPSYSERSAKGSRNAVV